MMGWIVLSVVSKLAKMWYGEKETQKVSQVARDWTVALTAVVMAAEGYIKRALFPQVGAEYVGMY